MFERNRVFLGGFGITARLIQVDKCGKSFQPHGTSLLLKNYTPCGREGQGSRLCFHPVSFRFTSWNPKDIKTLL